MTTTTGLIYAAKNLITGKYYIGQTQKTLEERIERHYKKTYYEKIKFGAALKKYTKEDWEWSVLIECPVEELNTWKKYYIKKFNAYESGYNSTVGGTAFGVKRLKDTTTVYELYHPQYGVVKATLSELSKKSEYLVKNLHKLLNESQMQIEGWVLLKNKERYHTIKSLNPLTLHHPDHGVITATIRKDFIDRYKISRKVLQRLEREELTEYKGWRKVIN